MKTNTLTPIECNALIQKMPCVGGLMPKASDWKRVDVGTLETYVGDRLYVITLIDQLPTSLDEVMSNGLSAEETAIRYLQGEGFLDEDFVYLGLQRFNKNDMPEGLDGIL